MPPRPPSLLQEAPASKVARKLDMRDISGWGTDKRSFRDVVNEGPRAPEPVATPQEDPAAGDVVAETLPVAEPLPVVQPPSMPKLSGSWADEEDDDDE